MEVLMATNDTILIDGILDNIISQIKTYNDMEVQKSGEKAYEHLIYRVKDKEDRKSVV